MEAEEFDLIVVGAGPAGAAAAIRAADAGLDVVVLERGSYPGSKNVSGGVIYGHAVREALPGFNPDDAPVERVVSQQGYWLMTADAALKLAFHSPAHAAPPENCFTVLRARWDPWFAEQAEKAGALLLPGIAVEGLLYEGTGDARRVVGVRTDRPDGELRSGAVLVASGVHALPELLALRPGGELGPKAVALAVKEVIHLGERCVADRFGLDGRQGAAYELIGEITGGMPGMGFLYTNRDSVSLGLGVILDDLAASGRKPHELLDGLKAHPAVRPYIAGGETVEYSAHLIPEGGYDGLPRLAGNGWLVAGDAAGLVNAIRREGSNLAIVSGLLAADAVVQARADGDFSAAALGSYARALRESFVIQDLRRYRRAMPYISAHRELFTNYPRLAAEVADGVFRTTGEARAVRARRMWRELFRARSPWNMARELYGLWRALSG